MPPKSEFLKQFPNDIVYKHGVYKITNTVNGKVYIGSSHNKSQGVGGRLFNHYRQLQRGIHRNRHLNAAAKIVGVENLQFEIISVIEKLEKFSQSTMEQIVRECEQFYMDYYKSYHDDKGYNLTRSATSAFGVIHTEEARRNMSEAHRGQVFTEEQRKNQRIGIVESIGVGCCLYTVSGEYIKSFESLQEAADFIGDECERGALSFALRSKSGKYKDYLIKPFKENAPLKINSYRYVSGHKGRSQSENQKRNIGKANSTSIVMLNEQNILLAEFESVSEARKSGISPYKSLGQNKFMNSVLYGKVKFLYKSDYEAILENQKEAA